MKLLETNFDKLKAENAGLKDELKLVKTEVENNTTKMAQLETKLQELQGHSEQAPCDMDQIEVVQETAQ